MDVTARLAAFAADLTYDSLPSEIRERAKMFILDAVGVMLGGVALHEANGDRHLSQFMEDMGPPGEATIVGYQQRTTPMLAAFANGNLSQTLDCQDTSLTGKIHTGSAVIPAVLAMGETLGAPGRAVIAATIAGYEVAARTALGVQPDHWFSGFQATGTMGTIGSAVTAANFLGLDGEGMATAIGMAGSILPLSNGDASFKGYTAKTVHGGHAAMVGIESAYLARAGFTAGPLEGEPPRRHAFLYLMSSGEPDLDVIVAGLGESWNCRDSAFKPYPVGIVIIGPVEIALDLMAEHGITVDQIEKVEVATYKEAFHFTGEIETTPESSEIECFLSLKFCVAVALMDGEMTWRQRLDKRLRDPATHELAARIHITEDPKMSKRYPNEWPAQLDIQLRNGEVVSKRLDQVKWSPRRPATWDELADKFIGMGELVIGEDRAKQAVDWIAHLEGADSLAPLLDLLRR